MSQVLVLSDDPRLEEGAALRGMKVARVRPARSRQTAKRSQRLPRSFVDVRGQQQLPAGLGRVPQSSTRQRHRARLVDARASSDARGHARRRHRVRPRTGDAAGARRRRSTCARERTTGSGRPDVRVRRRQRRRRRHDARREHRDRAGAARRGEILLIDLHVGHGDAAVLLGVEPRFSVLDALENVHRVDEPSSTAWSRRPRSASICWIIRTAAAGPIDPQRLHALLDFATRNTASPCSTSRDGPRDARRAGGGDHDRGRDEPGVAGAAQRRPPGADAAHTLRREHE